MPGAVLGFGSNVGDRLENITDALRAVSLLEGTRIIKISDVYETSPVGFSDQPDFLNCVALIETGFSPRALLGICMGIEAALGRRRNFKNGPRKIDVDFLLAEGATSSDKELLLPHPRIGERRFVLVPLMDLFPDGTAFGFRYKMPEAGNERVEWYGRLDGGTFGREGK